MFLSIIVCFIIFQCLCRPTLLSLQCQEAASSPDFPDCVREQLESLSLYLTGCWMADLVSGLTTWTVAGGQLGGSKGDHESRGIYEPGFDTTWYFSSVSLYYNLQTSANPNPNLIPHTLNPDISLASVASIYSFPGDCNVHEGWQTQCWDQVRSSDQQHQLAWEHVGKAASPWLTGLESI